MSSNQLAITDAGLININRKIINDRKFTDSLIQVNGDIPLRDGLISDFSKDSYLYKNDILIYGDSITTVISGIFTTSKKGHDQVAWYLSNTDKSKVIKLQFVDNKPQVVLPTGAIVNINIPFSDEMYFKAMLTLTSTSCSFIVEVEDDIFKEDRTLSSTLDLSEYTSIYIGNDPTQTEADEDYFWEGSLDLNGFSIYNNETTFYTPTTGYSLNITQMVISDGTIPLPQQPTSIFRHIYKYDIDKPIIRSDNTLLITSHLDEDSKLVIREVGLYAESNGETYLFGYLKGLNIDKSTGVPYDLILTVNLLLSVVNVVGFPDANSFILNIIKPALLKDYIKVQNVNAYLIENLERIIRMNSLQPIQTAGYYGKSDIVLSTETIDNKGHQYSKESSFDPSYYEGVDKGLYAWVYKSLNNDTVTTELIYTEDAPYMITTSTILYNRNHQIVEPTENGFHIGEYDKFPPKAENQSKYTVFFKDKQARVAGKGCCGYEIVDGEKVYVNTDDDGKPINPKPPTTIQSIGYNTPQIAYREQKKISEQQDCYSSTQTYAKLYKNIRVKTEDIFNIASVIREGDIEFTKKGEVSNFSIDNYFSLSAYMDNTKDWNFNFSFTINEAAPRTRSIVSLNQLDYYNATICALYGWTYQEPDTEIIHVIYTDKETIESTADILYDIYYQPVPQTSDGFHIVEEGSTFKIKYGDNNVERNESYDTEYYVKNNSLSFTPYLSVELDTSNDLKVSYFKNSKILHAWTQGSMNNLHIIYTEEETLSSTTKLYNSSYEKVSQDPNGFHVVQEGGNYVMKYGNENATLNSAFNLVYYSKITTENLLADIDTNKKCYITISYDKNAPTSASLTVTQGNRSTSKTITGLFSVPEINEIVVGDSYYCYNSYLQSPEGEGTTFTIGTIDTANRTSEQTIESTAKPFTRGMIDLLTWSVEQEDNNWLPTVTEVLGNAELLQYYHIPSYSRVAYTLQDICNPNYKLSVYYDTITGNEDLINFKDNEELSLCVKVDLKDNTIRIEDDDDVEYPIITTKPIIAKINDSNNILFNLELIKTENKIVEETRTKVVATYELKFTLATTEEPLVISIPISAIGIDEYTSNPILITIIKDSSGYLNMYRNNEFVIKTLINSELPSYENSHLTNNLSETDIIGKYIKEIIVASGALTKDELYYITNLTDTNFKFTNVENKVSTENISEN